MIIRVITDYDSKLLKVYYMLLYVTSNKFNLKNNMCCVVNPKQYAGQFKIGQMRYFSHAISSKVHCVLTNCY